MSRPTQSRWLDSFRIRRSLGVTSPRRARASRSVASCEFLEERLLLSATAADRDFTVMSRNLYVGTDLQPIINAVVGGDPNQILAAVSSGWQQVLATDFPERAEVLADEIADNLPLLVGLQEVALWRTGTALDPAAASNVEFDYLEILLSELSERGLNYTAVATATNFDAEVTGFTNPLDATSLRDIRLTDRDVILVRSDLPAADLKISNALSDSFTTNVVVPAGGGLLEITRGWTAVDAKIRGKEFRFINTHLELDLGPGAPPVQYYQTLELLAGPANTDLPVVLLGDFNAPAGEDNLVYQTLLGAGFQDAWSTANPGEDGFTCCHDADLRNETVHFEEGRIDLILFRGDLAARTAHLIGEDLADRTVGGLWPSDHAGVVATLVLAPRHAANGSVPQRPSRTLRAEFSDSMAPHTAATREKILLASSVESALTTPRVIVDEPLVTLRSVPREDIERLFTELDTLSEVLAAV